MGCTAEVLCTYAISSDEQELEKIRVVIAIVIVTAIPYAAAKLDDDLNPSTKPMHATIRAQLTSGT